MPTTAMPDMGFDQDGDRRFMMKSSELLPEAWFKNHDRRFS
jgi:hypothetical protein